MDAVDEGLELVQLLHGSEPKKECRWENIVLQYLGSVFFTL